MAEYAEKEEETRLCEFFGLFEKLRMKYWIESILGATPVQWFLKLSLLGAYRVILTKNTLA